MNKITILATFTLAAVLPAAALAADQDLDLSQAFALASDMGKNADAVVVPMATVVPVTVPLTAPAAAVKAAPKKWTIMVYVDGKNSLEEYIYTNLKQMEQVGSNDKVNVVVEVGRMNGQSQGDFHGDKDWTGCRRYLINKGVSAVGIASPILQTIPDCDMGDYNHAIDFGKWAMSNYPAEHYMYILWDHGGGWIKTVPGFSSAKAIALDEQSKHLIDTPQMGKIMKALGHIDVYGSDACLMQMAEVAYEIKGQTDFIVGSEKTEPGNGWQYADFLNKVNSSGLSALEVAKAAVDTYTPQYPTEATMSAIQSSALDGFTDKLNAFVNAVEASNGGKLAAAAREKSRNFEDQGEFTENKDLYDFASLVSASSKDKTVKTAAKDLMSYINGTLVVDNKVSKDLAKAHGVAIYAPTTGFDNDYNEMLFAGTKWPEFVKFMQK